MQPSLPALALALAFTTLAAAPLAAPAAAPGLVPGALASRSPLAAQAADLGPAPAGLPMHVVVGLALRDQAGLDAFLVHASTPGDPLFQHWLSPAQFAAQYAPTPAQEERVVAWLEASGFVVTQRTPDRLLVAANGPASAAQAAFGVAVHRVLYGGTLHTAVLDEPRFPPDIASFTTGVTGLDDLTVMHPTLAAPQANIGSSCCALSPADLAALYDRPGTATGSGEHVAIAGAYAWLDLDVQGFDSQWGLPALPAGSGQVCTGPAGVAGEACIFEPLDSLEISLDVEATHGTAPAAVVTNYMSASVLLSDFEVMYAAVEQDPTARIVTTSWGSCEAQTSAAHQTTVDDLVIAGEAKGQSWFAASGDSGSDDCGNGGQSVDVPADLPHVMGVGGTSATCSSGMTPLDPACHGYGSERGWSGSGGGPSFAWSKPSWQKGCSVPADGARDVPDVSLVADPNQYGLYVLEAQLWWTVGGTSDAAPQWAGYFALIDAAKGGAGLGLPGPRLYALCGSTALHDLLVGNNGAFDAGPGYDLVTGLGSADVAKLLAAY